MNILDLLKRNGRKEYMKYEDGKIIPVKVEENKNYQEMNLSPTEQREELKKAIKETVDVEGKVKRYGTFKTLKIVVAIAVLIFFGLTVKDIYVTFTDSSKPPVENVEPSDKGVDTTPKEPGDNGSFTPGNDSIGTVTPPKDEPKDEPNKEVEPDKAGEVSDLKKAIDASNVVNNMMVGEMAKEVGGMNEYFDNKMNRFSLEKRLKKSLETKQQLGQYLEERNDLFKEEEILPFYQATMNRLDNSIDMTTIMLESFTKTTTQNELTEQVNAHIKKEVELKEEQKVVFIKLLEDKKIKHTVDDTKGEISYTLN